MSRKVELLAPAGNPEGFYGAIHAGADAVYLAGSRFGARAYADNFTTEELIQCIRYAHIWGRKVYLTVNTLLKNEEISDVIPYLKPFYEAGLDGVIVQDIGVFTLIRDCFPDLELHVSTQMTLTGQYGASLLKKMGAVRIVPARELSLSEISTIKETTGLEIETFIHGAMCYCYSGQCLFSSILGGRSGNRGRCAQPCRLPYRVKCKEYLTEECFPLSLKDMCTIEHIPALIEAGIDSFKIEGRMKKPEYAAGVTAIYRKYIDKYYAGANYTVSQKDLSALGKLYIRSERQDGYYYRHNGAEMVTVESPSYSGTDEVYLESIRQKYLTKKMKHSVEIKAIFRIGEPASVQIRLRENDQIVVKTTGDVVSEALKQPITKENISKQLSKLGDTVFEAFSMDILLDDNAFYPLKSINELRRKVVTLLENHIICANRLCSERVISYNKTKDLQAQSGHLHANNMHISVRTVQQLQALWDTYADVQFTTSFINRIYIESDCLYEAFNQSKHSDNRIINLCNQFIQHGCQIVIALPPIIRQRDHDFLSVIWQTFTDNRKLFAGFLVRSMEGLGYLECQNRLYHTNYAIYTDANFYIWNSFALNAFAETNHTIQQPNVLINGFCLPYELKASEQRQLLETCRSERNINDLSAEKIIYGRIPLMYTANCVVKTTSKCTPNISDKLCYITDRYQKDFPVLRNCIHCMNVIYNSLPLSLHKELSKWKGLTDFRLDFTIEDEQETARILKYFLSGLKGEIPFQEYTTGHEKRGAE